MAEYRILEDLSGAEIGVERTADSTFIPADPANVDYQAYLAWVDAGNTPDPADTTYRKTSAFAAAEDVERLAVISERAATDPAYAALAEFVLRGRATA